MLTFSVDDLKVGQVLQLVWVKAYQHGATMRITKINRKTIDAEEVAGSYGGPCEVGHPIYKKGRPATKWRLHKSFNFTLLPQYDNDKLEWALRTERSYPPHYDWNK